MLLGRCTCDLTKANKVDNAFVFTAPLDKLEIMAAYYESINSPRHLNFNTRMIGLFDETVVSLRQDFDNRRAQEETIMVFGNQNSAIDPTPVTHDLDTLYTFCNPLKVALILRRVPNKSSSGLDGIPPIVLKHLFPRIIVNMAISVQQCHQPQLFPSLVEKRQGATHLKEGQRPCRSVKL